MTSRLLGSIGRFLITSGVVVLLFVGYQLWGTGLQEASAQDSLGSDFDELLLETPATTTPTTVPPTTTTGAPVTTEAEVLESTTTTSAVPSAGGTIPVFDEELAEALYRDGGDAIARITIPSLDVRKVVVEGVQVEDLRNGPGHYRSTVFPGQEGNSGIAGHRTTYGAPFNRIDELVPGDEINVRTVQGFHEYRVLPAREAFAPELLGPNIDFGMPENADSIGHIIVGPEATWVLSDFGDNRLTLTACHPKFSARQRIIVVAELVSQPVDTPPPPTDFIVNNASDLASEFGTAIAAADSGSETAAAEDLPVEDRPTARDLFANEVSLDEGLDGDEGAIVPALLWGAATMAAWFGFKELSRRWKRWPSVAMGVIPVVVLLALTFEKIDRFLPAG
ncbi:MAG: sortase [Acidimicrobiales bacterium]